MKRSSISAKSSALKAALYIRVSTHWQIDKDSLPVQREELINYSHYVLGITEYEVFEDAGYSGKNTDRPAYQQMMSRLRSGEFSHLVVWKIDRISRNLLDFAGMYAELKKLGITFVSKNEQFDTSNAMGEAMLKIILVFAELERNMTSERVTAVMLSRAKDGKWNGGKIPFGYDYDPDSKTFSINEAEARTVRLLYDLYDQSHSLIAVARRLNDMHILPRSGINWNPTTVSMILKSPFYIGQYRYNVAETDTTGKSCKRIGVHSESEWINVPDHHPAIIEADRQRSVIASLEHNRRSNKDAAKTYMRKHTHIFAGLLFCGCCGRQMQSTIDRPRADGYRPSIYLCSGKRRSDACTNKYISDLTVAPFVLNYIANIIKAQASFGKSTSIDTFEKKLLRGETFSCISHIGRDGLQEMYDMLRSGNLSGAVFSAPRQSDPDRADLPSEREILTTERAKKERALNRLQSLYLYSDEAFSERDFIIEKKTIQDAIETIDKRIAEIDKAAPMSFSLSDEDFMRKASVFILTDKLKDQRYVNFRSLLRTVEPATLKLFTNSVLQKVVVENGRITCIRFRNGLEHEFLYK